MSNVFLTSDLHVNHLNIIKYCDRPFASIEEMDEHMIARWNETVGVDDIVYVLGDYAMGDRKKGLSYLLRMNGTKILINGNHDRLSPVMKNSWKYQHEYLFDEDGNTLFSATMDFAQISLPPIRKGGSALKVLLSHYPYTGDHEDTADRYSQFRLPDLGKPLVHGHIHNDWLIKGSDQGTPMLNVGVDVHDFAPISAQRAHELIVEFRKSTSA